MFQLIKCALALAVLLLICLSLGTTCYDIFLPFLPVAGIAIVILIGLDGCWARKRIVPIWFCVVITLLIIISGIYGAFFEWTYVFLDYVVGVQGRYFLPLLSFWLMLLGESVGRERFERNYNLLFVQNILLIICVQYVFLTTLYR